MIPIVSIVVSVVVPSTFWIVTTPCYSCRVPGIVVVVVVVAAVVVGVGAVVVVGGGVGVVVVGGGGVSFWCF